MGCCHSKPKVKETNPISIRALEKELFKFNNNKRCYLKRKNGYSPHKSSLPAKNIQANNDTYCTSQKTCNLQSVPVLLDENPSSNTEVVNSHVEDICSQNALVVSSQKALDPETHDAHLLAQAQSNKSSRSKSQQTVKDVVTMASQVVSEVNVQVLPQPIKVDWLAFLESQHPYKMYNPAEDYDTIREIAKGSFGQVYLAKHRQILEEFAIKEIPIGSQQNQENIAMELEILRFSCHKNILFLTESYMYNGNVYIITDYIDGLPLSTVCTVASLCLTEVAVASITKECLQGLEYLHERSYVHCDIKGANILLSKDGKVKLIDFGLAIKTNTNINAGVRGTFFWRAPEICNNVPYGSKVDIWSLGMVVMEMLQEHPPLYWVDDVNQMLSLSKTGYTIMREDVQPTVSDVLKDFLYNGALLANPDARLSAHELLDHPFMMCGDNCQGLPWIVECAMRQHLPLNPG